MARYVLPHSELPLVRDPESSPPAPVASEAGEGQPTERKDWIFVKNMNPKERLVFLDGKETFHFPSQVFHTQDKALAEKILAVSDRYRISLQS